MGSFLMPWEVTGARFGSLGGACGLISDALGGHWRSFGRPRAQLESSCGHHFAFFFRRRCWRRFGTLLVSIWEAWGHFWGTCAVRERTRSANGHFLTPKKHENTLRFMGSREKRVFFDLRPHKLQQFSPRRPKRRQIRNNNPKNGPREVVGAHLGSPRALLGNPCVYHDTSKA